MKRRLSRLILNRVECWAAVVLLGWSGQQSAAQLAITEVMSSASLIFGTNPIVQGPDFWELTNFGTNKVDLASYQVSDKAANQIFNLGDASLDIYPGESVIFVRMPAPPRPPVTEAEFRAQWGTCLSTSVQVRLYMGHGLSSAGDEVHVYDSATNLIDQAAFGSARTGVTFVYDTNSWEFGAYSVLGNCGTCQAAMANDIGSPGVACGPVPLSITRQPANMNVCAGTEAILSVRVAGLPRPKYQWFFNNLPMSEATASSLTLTNVRPPDAGQYKVEMNNGLQVLQSAGATLSVSTNASPPNILASPADVEVYAGQAARFSVMVCAFPVATYQWLSNAVPIAGATNPTLRIPNATLPMSGSQYCVQIKNALGSNNVCARLFVTPKPDLMITEIMGVPLSTCAGHHGWFELTNQGTNTVNLFGYRFSDAYSLEGVQTNTQSVLLQPGQSVIFVKRMTPETFVGWWGTDNLTPGLKIITWDGFSLGGNTPQLYLWNGAAEIVSDLVDAKAYAEDVPGFSVYFDCRFDPNALCCYAGTLSEAAQEGAFRAEQCGDIASPGYTTNPPPRFVRLHREASGVTVKWRAVEGTTYALKYNNTLQAAGWMLLKTYTATNSVQTAIDGTPGNAGQRFYRLEQYH